MATSVKINRVQQLANDQKLVDGTKQFLSQMSSLPVGSQTVTPAQIVQVLEDRIATSKAAVAADDARKAAVKADRDERTKSAPFVHALKRIVIGMFLQSPDTLGVFGLHAPRVARTKAATKALAVEKTTATKKARGPIGRKQRAKVKGTVPTAGRPQPATAAPTPAAATPTPTAPTPTAPTPTAPTPTPSPSPAPRGGA
jgi:hypothetical protein